MTYLLRYSQFFSILVRPCHDSMVVAKFWQQLAMGLLRAPLSGEQKFPVLEKLNNWKFDRCMYF